MVVDPLSVVTAILTVVHLIRSAASTASQNKDKCLELAERVKTLGDILPSFAHPGGAPNDAATVQVLERLRETVGQALTLIESCKSARMFSGSKKAGELDGVDKRINNCIMDLNLISQARTNNAPAAGAGKVPAQTSYHSSYYQAQGAASTAHVAWPPTPQHAAWGTPQPQPQGYYHQPPGYGHWAPGPAHYPASPAPSGSNLSSHFTLPTVNKVFKRVYNKFH
jgi:hypothetical protein